MSQNRIYIGIDPGSNGAIAIIVDDVVYKVVKYDSYEISNIIKELVSNYSKDHTMMCTLEKVHSMPRDGVKQAFKFGENYGFVKGTLMALQIPFQEVTPMTWKKEYSLVKQEKLVSIKRCKELFPGISLLPSSRCTKESDGMAEALLICEYGRRHF